MDRWLCGLLGGYAVSFLFPIMTTQQFCGLLVFTSVLWLAQSTFPLHHRPRQTLVWLALLLSGLSYGTLQAQRALHWQLPSTTIGRHSSIELRLTEMVQVQPGYWRLEGQLLSLQGQAVAPPWYLPQPLVRLNWYEPEMTQKLPQAGEIWHFQARLRYPQGSRNQGGFLYHRYLLSHGIRALGSVQRGTWQRGEPSLRQQIYTALQRALQGQAFAGVMEALLLAERQQLPTAQHMVFQRTGLAHLIAISGLHLTLVAGGIVLLLRGVGWQLGASRRRRDQLNLRALAFAGAVVPVLGYAYLAGFGTATVRALLMFLVLLAHQALAINTPASRILLRAVALVLLVQPLAPLQPGFWLSVLAVAAMLLMHWRWPPARGRWQALRMLWRLEWLLTLALWPLTALWFGGLPMLAALTNLGVIPLFTFWLLPLGLLALPLLLLSESLAGWLLHLAQWPLAQLWPLLQWLAAQPWQWLPASYTGPLWLLLLWLGSMLLPLRWYQHVACAAGWFILVLWLRQPSPGNREYQLHVLDVEQGSAVVIEHQGQAVLIDTGADYDAGSNLAERAIMPFLQARRLRPVLAFVSHRDNDHAGGVAVLKQHYPELRWFGSGSGSACMAGQQGQWHDMRWQVLHPRNASDNRHNNDSCVLLLQFGALRVLLPGDIEQRGERDLLANSMAVRAQILVLAHHGSNSSSERYFLRHVAPSVALASRGRNNSYGLVHPQVRERLAGLQIPLLETATGGQITLVTDGRQWRLSQPFAAVGSAWFDADSVVPRMRN